MTLGETIRIFHKAKGYTAKQFAELCGISYKHLLNIETKTKRISIEKLKIIADALKVPGSKIVEVSENSEKENWDFPKTLSEVLKICVGE